MMNSYLYILTNSQGFLWENVDWTLYQQHVIQKKEMFRIQEYGKSINATHTTLSLPNGLSRMGLSKNWDWMT